MCEKCKRLDAKLRAAEAKAEALEWSSKCVAGLLRMSGDEWHARYLDSDREAAQDEYSLLISFEEEVA